MPIPVPLRERRRDWFFIAAFVIFAATSFLMDPVNVFGRPDPESTYVMSRIQYESYAAGADPLIIANPRFVQLTLGISAFILGPFYLVLIYAFVRGRDWIRLPAIFYAGIPVMGTTLYLGVGLLGDAGVDYKFLDTAKVLASNLPYIVVPLLLVARMWRPHPFTRREDAVS